MAISRAIQAKGPLEVVAALLYTRVNSKQVEVIQMPYMSYSSEQAKAELNQLLRISSRSVIQGVINKIYDGKIDEQSLKNSLMGWFAFFNGYAKKDDSELRYASGIITMFNEAMLPKPEASKPPTELEKMLSSVRFDDNETTLELGAVVQWCDEYLDKDNEYADLSVEHRVFIGEVEKLIKLAEKLDLGDFAELTTENLEATIEHMRDEAKKGGK